jgi:dihydroorotate dehydrogenase (NAD+) catalytic subunit
VPATESGLAAVGLGSLKLPSPILVAAGAVGYVSEVARGVPLAGLGAVVTGGLWLQSRRGGPPRLTETRAGVLWSRGSRRTGVAEVLRRHARTWPQAGAPVIASVCAADPAELPLIAAELEGASGVVALELDLATVEDEGGLFSDPRTTAGAVRQTRLASSLPVLVKLPLDATDAVLQGCAAAGADAVTVGCGLRAGDAWLVGPGTLAVALERFKLLATGSPVPLVACGGVATAEHARAYLRAGAAAVQVGSAHLSNPCAAVDILAAL